jgi:hypothetical protein
MSSFEGKTFMFILGLLSTYCLSFTFIKYLVSKSIQPTVDTIDSTEQMAEVQPFIPGKIAMKVL